jgi:glycosyltransferase involved in cell wall biosynthesis
MKVLFLTNIPAPYRIDFFNELGRYCELTVWFEAKNEANREWKVEGLGERFRYVFLPGFTIGLDRHVNWSILHALEREPFDVYIMGCYSSPTEMLAIGWLKRKKKKFILNSDGGFPAADRWLLRKLKTSLISSANLWLSSGSNCTRYLIEYGANREQIVEYPLSSVKLEERELAALTEEERATLKQENGLKETVILAIGQFIPRKGFDLLLDAFVRMDRDGVSLLLIGGGPEREAYEEKIRDQGIRNVIIKDFMHKQELLRYWKLADIFVMPTRYDIWGLVLNEALSLGLPIISTTMAGAAHDLIEEAGNGFLVPPDNAEALADRCARLVDDYSLRRAYGERSLQIANRYRMERMVEKHVDVLNEWYKEG